MSVGPSSIATLSESNQHTVIDIYKNKENSEQRAKVNKGGDVDASSAITTDTNDYNPVNNEIWSAITGQPDASLNVLHKNMQLNQNNNNIDGNDSLDNVIHQLDKPQSSTKPTTEASNQLQVISDKDDKPAVGTAEWHKLRRENHKQVERRRRETINEGILEISRIVPGCEKNKGSILQRAAVYIRQLKEAESATVEKWTLEKLLTDQAISELNRQIEVLKTELDRVRLENRYLKRELEITHSKEHSQKKQKLREE